VSRWFFDSFSDVQGRLFEILNDRTSSLDDCFVLCGSGVAGVELRRSLATHDGPVVCASFLSFDQFSHRLAEPALLEEGLSIASSLQVQTAIARLCESDVVPESYRALLVNFSSQELIADVYRKIRSLPVDRIDKLRANADGFAQVAIDLASRVEDFLTDGFVGQSKVIELALSELKSFDSKVVVYLPSPDRALDVSLLRALNSLDNVDFVVGLSGVTEVDASSLAWFDQFGISIGSQPEAVISGTKAPTVEVPDPEIEVEVAIRSLINSNFDEDIGFEQIAVFYSDADVYKELIESELAVAGVSFASVDKALLSSTVVGRFVTQFFELAQHGVDRRSFVDFVLSSPVCLSSGRRLVPGSFWDSLSRKAGVTKPDTWDSRLDLLRSGFSTNKYMCKRVEELALFVKGLQEDLSVKDFTWSALTSWLNNAIDKYLLTSFGDDDESFFVESDRIELEMAALQQFKDFLVSLAEVDSSGSLSMRMFSDWVLNYLEATPVSYISPSCGVTVAPLGVLRGVGFEKVCIVGLAESVFPRVVQDDPILSNALLEACEPANDRYLLKSSDLARIDVETFVAAIGSSKSESCVTFSRGSLRSRKPRNWPDALNPFTEQSDSVGSFIGIRSEAELPLSESDFVVQSLMNTINYQTKGLGLETLPNGLLDDNILSRLSASSVGFDDHTGLIGDDLLDISEIVFSPTAVETFVKCPRRFLFSKILKLREEDIPEKNFSINALKKGSLVHLILERFVLEALEHDQVPEPQNAWSEQALERLDEISAEELSYAVGRGETGGVVHTELLRKEIANIIAEFIDKDRAFRSAYGSKPVASELSFGMDDNSEPITIETAAGLISLRGSVDRVDKKSDGSVIVSDYKTGSGRLYTDKDPLDGGEHLQLPIYHLAASRALDVESEIGYAKYWMLKPGEKHKNVTIDGNLRDRVDQILSVFAESISAGLFPGKPGEAVTFPKPTCKACTWCEFDRICPKSRQAEQEKLETIEELQAVFHLGEPKKQEDK